MFTVTVRRVFPHPVLKLDEYVYRLVRLSSINNPLLSLVSGSWSNLGALPPTNTTLPNSSVNDAGPVLWYVILGSNFFCAAKFKSNVGRKFG